MDSVFTSASPSSSAKVFESEGQHTSVVVTQKRSQNITRGEAAVFCSCSSSQLDSVFCDSQKVASSPIYAAHRQDSQGNYEVVRCTVCANLVRAKVLEKSAMVVKYQCTHPGCNALFSADGTIAQAAKFGQKLVGIINIGIAGYKLLSGDFSNLRNLADDLGSLTQNG
jgi:hypothetical protein